MDGRELDESMHAAYVAANELVASVLPGAVTERLGDWFVYDAGVDNPDFNIAAVLGDPLAAARQRGEVEAWFEFRETEFRYKLRPGEDLCVIACLPSSTGEVADRQPYLVLPAGAWGSAAGNRGALRIVEVRDEAMVGEYDAFDAERGRPAEWSIAGASLGIAECGLWLGYADGRAVARAMSVATTPVGSIANVVVVERDRGRGFGRAITAAAVEACWRNGSEFVCLGSSAMGLPMYRSMGFEERYELATYGPR